MPFPTSLTRPPTNQGSMIEEWMPNTTVSKCSGAKIAAHNQMLWDGNVVPFLGMTMKGFLWYQVTPTHA